MNSIDTYNYSYRPLALGYRRSFLTASRLNTIKPSVKYMSVIQPMATRTFSSTFIRLNNEQVNTKVIEKTNDEVVTKPQSRISKFIQHSKDLIRFYKDGLKLLWSNNKQAKALLQKVKNEGYVLNRSEFQLVHQSKKDMIKLIPFGFVFMILPESVSTNINPSRMKITS